MEAGRTPENNRPVNQFNTDVDDGVCLTCFAVGCCVVVVAMASLLVQGQLYRFRKYR